MDVDCIMSGNVFIKGKNYTVQCFKRSVASPENMIPSDIFHFYSDFSYYFV